MWNNVKLEKAAKGWNDEWTKIILKHERNAGKPRNVGDANSKGFGDNGGYDDKDWIDNGKFVREYVEKVYQEVENAGISYNDLPPEVQVRLVDYKFNTGRSTVDLLTFALNRQPDINKRRAEEQRTRRWRTKESST